MIADDFKAIQKRRLELGGERWPDRKVEPEQNPEPQPFWFGGQYGWPLPTHKSATP